MGYSYAALVEVVRRRLTKHPDIGLAAIARDTGVDRHTLSRALRLRLGLTFRAFKAVNRRETATRLLQHSAHLSIKQVAYSAGYRSASGLGRDMRQHFGVSPSRWRSRVTEAACQFEGGFPRIQHDEEMG